MGSPPSRPLLKARYERRRQAVIEQAAELFAKRGFDATSIEDLSEASELTVGGLYHYIGGKDDLLYEILNQLMGPLLIKAREIQLGSGTAVDRFRELMRAWVNHIADHKAHMIVFSQERHVVEHDRRKWQQARRSRRRFESLLAEMLDEALEEIGGEPPDTRLMALGLLGMVNYAPQWMKKSGRLSPDAIADGFSQIVLSQPTPTSSPEPDERS
jgi:TetR/AcrR family transcriptional regulator, cholesterol catabolism regulator